MAAFIPPVTFGVAYGVLAEPRAGLLDFWTAYEQVVDELGIRSS